MKKKTQSAKQKAKNAKSPITNHQSLITKLSWLPKKTFELEFTIPWKQVKEAYDIVLKEAVSLTTIKGFRKGKAPAELVEKSLNKQELYQKALQKLLPQTYDKAIKQHHLSPIMSPKITPISLKENKDWQFKAVSCERPDVKLGDYEQAVKGSLAKDKIWTPKKGDLDKKEKVKQSYDQKMKIITKTLLDHVEIEISDMLIENEVNQMLTRFLDQVNALGMNINQYLSSKGINNQQLRAQYKKQADETLKIEFILQQIVMERKIKVEKNEIEKMVQATPDKKIQKKLNTPMQQAYISSILAKRKALDYLTSL